MTLVPEDDSLPMQISRETRGIAASKTRDVTQHVEHFYFEHYHSVYRYLLLTGSSPADADDFAQEAFLGLLRYLKSGQSVEKPKSWLLSVAHYGRHHHEQKGDRQSRLNSLRYLDDVDSQADPGLDPETTLLERERLSRVSSAMEQLTGRQAEYLNLRAEGLKLREIAEIFGVTVQSVAETCARAIERLKRLAHE